MERPLLIASDADGTLLDDADRVGARTRAAITRAVRSGTPVVIASGRPPRWLPWVAEAAGVDGYAVCCNGAVRYDVGRDRVVSAETVSPELLDWITSRLRAAIRTVRFAVERVGTSSADPAVDPFQCEDEYTHPWPGEERHTAPLRELIATPCVKLLARAPDRTSDEMAGIARELTGEYLSVTYSERHGLLEFAAPSVTKATGLAAVAAECGVHAADVVAFGDMPNDLDMLHWAGHGVAMGNAHPEVLAIADEVTASNNDDGIADVLERWF